MTTPTTMRKKQTKLTQTTKDKNTNFKNKNTSKKKKNLFDLYTNVTIQTT